MIISILRDKKDFHICLTPQAVSVLVQNRHTVLIEGKAEDKIVATYLNVGAYIIDTKEELLDRGGVLVKKNEPENAEVEYLNGEEKIFFTTIDFARRNLIEKVLTHKIAIIHYPLLEEIKSGVVKVTDRVAFSNYTLPFLLGLANNRLEALVDDETLREALIMMNGKVYNDELAKRYNYQCYEF